MTSAIAASESRSFHTGMAAGTSAGQRKDRLSTLYPSQGCNKNIGNAPAAATGKNRPTHPTCRVA